MKALRGTNDMQVYSNQAYIGWLLDDEVFDILNCGDGNDFLYKQGALDANDFIPAGSMYNDGKYYDQTTCERGRTLAEVEEENNYIEWRKAGNKRVISPSLMITNKI